MQRPMLCPVKYFHDSPEAMLRFGRMINIYMVSI